MRGRYASRLGAGGQFAVHAVADVPWLQAAEVTGQLFVRTEHQSSRGAHSVGDPRGDRTLNGGVEVRKDQVAAQDQVEWRLLHDEGG